MDPIDHFDNFKHVSLETFRRSGAGISTPMWFARHGDVIWMRTPRESAKAKRIAANPRVTLRPSTMKGEPIGDHLWNGTAQIIEHGDEAETANRLLHDRYGWMYNTLPMIPVPGATASPKLTVADRLRYARTKTLWPTSVILKITLSARQSTG